MDGRSLDYRLDKKPTQEEVQELTLYWLRLAETYRAMAGLLLEHSELCHVECLGMDAQWGLERSFKGLLTARNDPVRFRRDAGFLWRHVESVWPIRDREGAQAMENLLAAAVRPEGLGCSLTAFSEAYRRNAPYPEISDDELAGTKLWIEPALDSLITEVLARSGATRDDLRRERRSGLGLP